VCQKWVRRGDMYEIKVRQGDMHQFWVHHGVVCARIEYGGET
jgi:hypothetical protein